MKVSIVGAGYVGLVTAACFAEFGHDVLCVEKIPAKLAMLRGGEVPIYEPGLDELVRKHQASGRLRFASEVREGVAHADVIFLCVGTPQSDDGSADLSQIEGAAREIAQSMSSPKTIVEKSTVPVNTNEWIRKTVHRYKKSGAHVRVCSNPEFLREGSALEDFMNPDRIIVGVEGDEDRATFRELYRPLLASGREIIFTNPAEAELIKHAANSFLAMKISYANMLADLCSKTNASVKNVVRGIGLDTRIGTQFLNAGIGYGGSCFPKDVKAFIRIAEEHGADFALLREVEAINGKQRIRFCELVEEVLWINKDKRIAVWGLAFKPNTDDIRESPAIEVVRFLKESGARLILVDPKAAENFQQLFPESDRVRYTNDAYASARDADALILLTEWEEFRAIDLAQLRREMSLPIIIDGRNMFDRREVEAAGFEYYGMGT